MAKRIMTVDDSASVRQMVAMTLKKEGYDVIEASDGKDALSKMSGTIDMVITDLNMPNLDGIGLIKGIRAQAGKKAEGKSAGATGWIVKPFTPDQLLAVVKKVLR